MEAMNNQMSRWDDDEGRRLVNEASSWRARGLVSAERPSRKAMTFSGLAAILSSRTTSAQLALPVRRAN